MTDDQKTAIRRAASKRPAWWLMGGVVALYAVLWSGGVDAVSVPLVLGTAGVSYLLGVTVGKEGGDDR